MRKSGIPTMTRCFRSYVSGLWTSIRTDDSPPISPEALTSTEGYPPPFHFNYSFAAGKLAVVRTADGDRMRLELQEPVENCRPIVLMRRRNNRVDSLSLFLMPDQTAIWQSNDPPKQPYECIATLRLAIGDTNEMLAFDMFIT